MERQLQVSADYGLLHRLSLTFTDESQWLGEAAGIMEGLNECRKFMTESFAAAGTGSHS